MIINEEDWLAHYGTPRRSGRYPWGSGGEDGGQRSRSFLDYVEGMRAKGMSETEIAKGLDMSTTKLRAMKSIAKNEKKQADIAMAQRLKEKGLSNVAIGERMSINESSVRSLLEPGQKYRADVLQTTANMLRDQVDEKGFVDIGAGVENHIGVSATKLSTAVAVLKEEGYRVHTIQVDQQFGGANNKTNVKVLAPPGTEYKDIAANKDKIHQITEVSEDGGLSFGGMQPPLSISSSRVGIRYAEDGGSDADGVIYVRPGVHDLSLGGARYAQVRIAVDGTHYLKGMAMHKEDLPKGVDLMFNTTKSNTGNKLDAMKEMKADDPNNPFGSVVRQLKRDNPDGTKSVISAMNIVNEEGNWGKWSKTLSSQMLSKQSPSLAKTQLDMTFERKKKDLDEIMALTNPTVRRKLLESYADDADSSSVHLKAAALPRQASHVILPINSMKPTEVYAPNYRNGERVVLIRYPHGGTFEIPELTVNNNHPEAKSLLGRAPDAIGINHQVAKRLSGADFDGDTVLVIPNNSGTGRIKTSSPLAGLKDFDPQAAYPRYEGMKLMTPRVKGIEMGQVSNLITDMTIKGASTSELARAVRHSMVVIDAEKHKLNWRQSAKDNGIAQLKAKYQGRSNAGASTLISRAKSQTRLPYVRTPRSAARGGPVDKATGKKVYDIKEESYVNKQGKTVQKTTLSKQLAETEDAFTLSSGTPIEKVYAEHSNRLKNLANSARKEAVNTPPPRMSPSAKKVYANEVASLNAALNVALKNKPLERQAQIIAGANVNARRQANPDMDAAELKKIKGLALTEARVRVGAKKQQIQISDKEWEAIQAGAISNHKLTQILGNADLDRVKQLATPKTQVLMTATKHSRAKAMLDSGYTQAEVADALGVSVTTLKNSMEGE